VLGSEFPDQGLQIFGTESCWVDPGLEFVRWRNASLYCIYILSDYKTCFGKILRQRAELLKVLQL
jgi:hypothetical protein